MTDCHRARVGLGLNRQSTARAGRRLANQRAFEHDVAAQAEQPGDVAVVPHTVVPGTDCRDALRQSRRHNRVIATFNRRKEDDMSSAARAFAEQTRDDTTRSLIDSSPRLASCTGDFQRTSTAALFQTIEFLPDAKSLAEELVSKAMTDKRLGGFLQYLEAEWRRKHATIMHAACPPIQAPTVCANECQRAGMCICSKPLLKRFAARFSALFKAECPPGSTRRDLVNAASLVVLLSAVDSGGEVQEHFFHLALVTWSPYTFVAHRLGMVKREGRNIHLQACNPRGVAAPGPHTLPPKK